MYQSFFEHDQLIKTYQGMKRKKFTTGLDRITKAKYDRIYKSDLTTTSNKILCNTYTPTPYKEVLLVKNRTSPPRMLSLPTIRDKIILEVIKRILTDRFNSVLTYTTVSGIVECISNAIKNGTFDAFIKLDLKGFYDSIDHETLLNKTRTLIENDDFLSSLIYKFISNCTKADGSTDYEKNKLGVPQGISISNILGNIYLSELDCDNINATNYQYIRYVDDILILCTYDEMNEIKAKIIALIESTGSITNKLKVNVDKCQIGHIETIDFLGYKFLADGTISIADNNIKKISNSIEKIFSDYYSSQDKRIKGNIDLLKWKLDIKITGCFRNKRRYGWVIFFQQNECEEIMHKLDWLVIQLCKRFKLSKSLLQNDIYIGKKFVKTYHEFKCKKEHTEYILNVDKFSQQDKRDILINICKRKASYINSRNDFLLNREFDRFIFYSIKDIEKDLYQIYT